MWAEHEWSIGGSWQQQDGAQWPYRPAMLRLPQHRPELGVLIEVIIGIRRVLGQRKMDEDWAPCCILHQNVVGFDVVLDDTVLVDEGEQRPELLFEASVCCAASMPAASLHHDDLLLPLW